MSRATHFRVRPGWHLLNNKIKNNNPAKRHSGGAAGPIRNLSLSLPGNQLGKPGGLPGHDRGGLQWIPDQVRYDEWDFYRVSSLAWIIPDSSGT